MSNIFYVYQLRLDGYDQPFYIGKGRGNRAYSHLSLDGVNGHKNNIIKKAMREGVKIHVEFIAENLSEEQAFRIEVWSIHLHGRWDMNEGPLTNKTDGGEGSSGAKPSKKVIKRRVDSINKTFKENPERLKMRNEAIRLSKKNPNYLQNISEKSIEMWKDDDYKRKMKIIIKERWSVNRDKMLAAQPEYTEGRRERMREVGNNMENIKQTGSCPKCGRVVKGPSLHRHIKHCS